MARNSSPSPLASASTSPPDRIPSRKPTTRCSTSRRGGSPAPRCCEWPRVARPPQRGRWPAPRSSPIVIIAGALASLSAAVVASYFGVAGTFIGTAVVSIVSSLAAALYAGLLGRTRGLVQRTTTVLRAPTPHPEDRDARASAEAPGERGPSGGPGEGEASDHRRGGGLAGLPWRRSALVVGVAVLIFAIAIGAVTGIEAAIKEPIAAALGVRDKGQARTSVGVAVNRASGPATTQSPGPSSPSPSTQPQAPTS